MIYSATNNKSTKKIDYRFKLLYFFCILFVLFDHSNGGGITFLYNWFHFGSFVLASFAFASGYFFKPERINNPLRFISKKFLHIILPLYIYNLFYGLLVFLLKFGGFTIGGEFNLYNLFAEPLISGHQFSFNLGGWFMVPLFVVEVFSCLIYISIKKLEKSLIKDIAMLVLYISLGILGIELAMHGFNTEWYLFLTRFLYLMPFFGIGIFYKNHLEKFDKKISSVIYIPTIFLLQLIMFCCHEDMPFITPSVMNFQNVGSVGAIIYGILGTAFWLRVSQILVPILSKNRFVNIVADNTYSIAINHLLGFFILNSVYFGFSSFIPIFKDFNVIKFKSDIFYLYLIRGVDVTKILYVVFGLIFSLFVGIGVKKLKDNIYRYITNVNKRRIYEQSKNS